MHSRLVQVGHNPDGTAHMIPTDSRFLDNEELDRMVPPNKQYRSKNGKRAGLILMTTPTESTSNLGHHTEFTHNIDENSIKHAIKNKGEYEIDNPIDQETSADKKYIQPQPIKILKKKPVKLANGGSVKNENDLNDDDFNAFPERNFASQYHLAKRYGIESIEDVPHHIAKNRLKHV